VKPGNGQTRKLLAASSRFAELVQSRTSPATSCLALTPNRRHLNDDKPILWSVHPPRPDISTSGLDTRLALASHPYQLLPTALEKVSYDIPADTQASIHPSNRSLHIATDLAMTTAGLKTIIALSFVRRIQETHGFTNSG
jgi:hypothetical protein